MSSGHDRPAYIEALMREYERSTEDRRRRQEEDFRRFAAMSAKAAAGAKQIREEIERSLSSYRTYHYRVIVNTN